MTNLNPPGGNGPTKLIEILDVQAGKVRETVFQPTVSPVRAALREKLGHDYDPVRELREHLQRVAYEKHLGMDGLQEAFVASPDAANMLRDGIKFLSFLAYAEMPQTYTAFASMMTSNKPQEEYLRDATMGVIPRTPSGTTAPLLNSNFEGGVTIKNNRYAGMVEIKGDDLRFDRLGKINQIAPEMGRAARMTEEYTAYTDITTTANYTRSNTTGDNDVGANTQTLTFSPTGFETAMAIISTARDRKSGTPLGLMADTLITTPLMEWPVKQLLLSDFLQRAYGGAGAAEVRGMGTTSPYRGAINKIIVSPWFGASYQWALVDTRRQSYIWQTVEPVNVYQEGANANSEAWFTRDSLRYLVQMYFGSGFVDDRPWFYSDSTTTPAVG